MAKTKKTPKVDAERKKARDSAEKRVLDGTIKRVDVEGYIRGWFRKPSTY